MIKVRVAEITNISNQIVMIPYNPISTDSSVTDIDATASGILQLQPGTKFSIEEDRLLDLKPLLQARMITVITRKIKAHKPVPYILNGVASAQGLGNASAVGDSTVGLVIEPSDPPSSGQVGVLYSQQFSVNQDYLDTLPPDPTLIWTFQDPPPGNAQLGITSGLLTWEPESSGLYGLRIGVSVNTVNSPTLFWEVNVPF